MEGAVKNSFVFALGCLSIIPGCKRKFVSQTAFFPPSPPGYEVRKNGPDLKDEVYIMMGTGRKVDENDGPIWEYRLPTMDQSRYGTIEISMLKIPSLDGLIYGFRFFRNDAAKTIIYSHGNAADIGKMFPMYLELARHLQVNVVAYDFSGYGSSNGTPSEVNIISDIETVYEYLVNNFALKPEDTILYGQSLGTVPTIELGSRIPKLCGVVIHSGMKSGITALVPGYESIHWFDIFKNINKINQVESPKFIIHGAKDTIIPVSHGYQLYKSSTNVTIWTPNEGGHNDIEAKYKLEYFERLRNFIHYTSNRINVMASSEAF